MLFRTISSLLLSSLLLVAQVEAFPSNAGACNAGEPAVGGIHLTKNQIQTGSLAEGQVTLTIDDEPVTDGYVFRAGVDHIIKIEATPNKFRGFLIRVGGAGTDALTLIDSSTTTAIAPLCTGAGVSGVTHNDASRKDDVEAILRVDQDLTLTLDVTVVLFNRGQRSSYWHSSFGISSLSSAPTPPTISPAMAPTISVDPELCSECSEATITIAGSSTVEPVAKLWAATYAETCDVQVTVEGGGSSSGSRRVCANDSRGETAVMIGDMSRGWRDSEGLVQADGYTYDCVHGDTTIDVIQIDVAIDGLTVATRVSAEGNSGASCIDLLGGLTLDQLRWIFSSYTVDQLVATGWDPSSVANLDDSDSTHLWSELDSRCANEEIDIGGADDESGTYEYFTETVFVDIDNGETFRLPYFNSAVDEDIVDFVDANIFSIAYFGFAFFSENRDIFFGVPIQNSDGDLIAPTANTVGSGEYNPLARRIWMNLNTDFLDCTRGVIDYGMSAAGVLEVQEVGYVPIPASERTQMKNRVKEDDDSGGGAFCFSANNAVNVLGKGEVDMASLKIGDKVLAANNKYETVYSFGHYSHSTVGEYVQFWTGSKNLAAELSSNHMIFVGGEAKAAATIKIGDMLDMADGSSRPVTKITNVKRQGAYAPFTKSGVLVVNGVLASSFVSLKSNSASFAIGGFKTVSDQFAAFMSEAPHRLVCAVSFGICEAETYTAEGLSTWIATPLAMTTKWLEQPTVVNTLAFGPYVFICALALAVEFVFSNAVALLLVAAGAHYVYGKTSTKKN